MIDCICIDDKNRPKEIPASKWIVEGDKYRITHVYVMRKMGNILGVTLYEKPLDESCAPYEMYRLSRFIFTEEEFKRLAELAKDCSELNDWDMGKIEELLLEQLVEMD